MVILIDWPTATEDRAVPDAGLMIDGGVARAWVASIRVSSNRQTDTSLRASQELNREMGVRIGGFLMSGWCAVWSR